jgi:hypothetical protein
MAGHSENMKPYLKKEQKQKMAEVVAQVGKHLPSKHDNLNMVQKIKK